jgi:two-component system, repressor protein LuxO
MNIMKLLIVEDDEPIVNLIKRFLSDKEVEITHKSSVLDGLEEIETSMPNLVLLDLNLPDGSGIDLLKEIKKRSYPCEVIIITANGSVGNAVTAMSNGAFDFLEKPFNSDRLLISIHNALEHHRLYNVIEEIQATGRSKFHGFIGVSVEMQLIYQIIQNCAASNATVLIQGESGTGKEICATAIHHLSNNSQGNFVPLNCASIPQELMESEFFGHIKGAFTGAVNDRKGAVSNADNGTLFLDEIGELSLDIQAKLLRFLQTSEFQKLGSNKLEKVNARILCATNRNLLNEVKKGSFREDLYYRLNVIQVDLPPLRDRSEDILLLAQYFLNNYSREESKKFEALSQDVTDFFVNYPWPGNVRQLQNVIHNIVVLNTGKIVTLDMLPGELKQPTDNKYITGRHTIQSPLKPEKQSGNENAKIKSLWQVEKETIETAISSCNGNIPKAAALLEVSPSTIYRKKLSWK